MNAYRSIVKLENEEDENLQDEEVSDKSKCNHSMSDQEEFFPAFTFILGVASDLWL